MGFLTNNWVQETLLLRNRDHVHKQYKEAYGGCIKRRAMIHAQQVHYKYTTLRHIKGIHTTSRHIGGDSHVWISPQCALELCTYSAFIVI
jgi:hypothetical protein